MNKILEWTKMGVKNTEDWLKIEKDPYTRRVLMNELRYKKNELNKLIEQDGNPKHKK